MPPKKKTSVQIKDEPTESGEDQGNPVQTLENQPAIPEDQEKPKKSGTHIHEARLKALEALKKRSAKKEEDRNKDLEKQQLQQQLEAELREAETLQLQKQLKKVQRMKQLALQDSESESEESEEEEVKPKPKLKRSPPVKIKERPAAIGYADRNAIGFTDPVHSIYEQRMRQLKQSMYNSMFS